MKEITHRCPACNRNLEYNESLSSNYSKFSEERLERLWNCKYLQFYCCECYEVAFEKVFRSKIEDNPYRICTECGASVHYIEFRMIYNTYSIENLIKIWEEEVSKIYFPTCHGKIIRKNVLEKYRKMIYNSMPGINELEKKCIEEIITQRCFPVYRLERFEFNRNGFTIKDSHIKTLVLAHSQLTELPPSIGNLRHLTRLYLDSNKLEKIPNTIEKLCSLKVLRLGDNHLSELPSSIKKLTQLTQLCLEGNQFNILPECIMELEGLRYLDISRNDIQKIPVSLEILPDLKILYMMNIASSKLVQTLKNIVQERTLIIS